MPTAASVSLQTLGARDRNPPKRIALPRQPAIFQVPGLAGYIPPYLRLIGDPSSVFHGSVAPQSWFAELTESQRQTLHLFFHQGYTFEEIATKLGKTVGNATNHYYRGLDKLRKQISADRLPGKEAAL